MLSKTVKGVYSVTMRHLIWLLLLVRASDMNAADPTPICDVLRACSLYDGKIIEITGRYYADQHRRAFSAPCQGDRIDQPFAVADWTRYNHDPVHLDKMGGERSGPYLLFDRIVTSVVEVQCTKKFRLIHTPKTGEQFGTGEGYNGLGAVRFYIKKMHVPDGPKAYAPK